MKEKSRETIKVKEVFNYDKKDFVTERVWVDSHDGKRIPMTIVHKKGIKRDGKAPLVKPII